MASTSTDHWPNMPPIVYKNVTSLSLLRTLCLQLIFSCIRAIVVFLQEWIWWPLTGLSRAVAQARRCDVYTRSAHVLDIVWRYSYEPSFGNNERDFLAFHHSFTSPDIVRTNDNITLYSIDFDKAVFVQTDEGVCVWEKECGSFYSDMQHRRARRLIVIYQPALHQLLAKFPWDLPRMVLILNPARSGSVLLSKVFENTQKCVTLTEPSVIDDLSTYYASATSEDKRQQCDILTHTALRLLCKPINKRQSPPYAFVLKSRAQDFALSENFHRLFGSERCPQLFVYRRLTGQAPSFWNMQNRSPLVKIICLMDKVPGLGNYILKKMASGAGVDVTIDFRHPFRLPIMSWFLWMLHYRHLRRDCGIPLVAVLYDDLVKQPAKVLMPVFEHCHLPGKELLPLALTAFHEDAQEKSCFNRQAMACFTPPPFSQDLIERCNIICAMHNLPLVDSDCIVDGLLGR